MKKLATIVAVIAALCWVGSASAAPLYDVWQDTDGDGAKDTWLGQISHFSGGLTGAGQYNYFSASGHPIGGPAPVAYESKLWLYNGSDGLSLGMIHNIDAGGNQYWNHIKWDLDITGTATSVRLADDGTPENQSEVGIVKTGTHYDCGWAYVNNTDGGVIGGMTGTNWEIKIDPIEFGDIQDWDIYSGSGSSIHLWSNPSGLPSSPGTDFYASTNANTTYITPVPEPTTLFLLGSGLLGLGAAYRRRRNAS